MTHWIKCPHDQSAKQFGWAGRGIITMASVGSVGAGATGASCLDTLVAGGGTSTCTQPSESGADHMAAAWTGATSPADI